MPLQKPAATSQLRDESIRFLIGGIANTLLSYLVYLLLLLWLSYATAYTGSYVIGIITAFFINTLFVFRCPWSWKKLLSYPLVHLFNYAAGLGIVSLGVRVFHIDQRIAPIVATVVMFPLTFVLTRFLLRFRAVADQKPEGK